MIFVIIIKDIKFEVEIKHKRIKNMYLKLDGKCIIASVPLLMEDYEVYKFIELKKNWIYKTYNYNLLKNEKSRMYNNQDYFYIFGVKYRLNKIIGKKTVIIKDDVIYLSYPNNSEDSIKFLYKFLDNRLLSYAEKYVDKYLPLLEDYSYFLRPLLSAKRMHSKWGVCYTKKNKINISSYLIHYPLNCLEYIILHEMTHFIIPNHSKRFYEIVKSYMPMYKEISKELR